MKTNKRLKILVMSLLISTNFMFCQEKEVKLRENETLTIYGKESGKVENGVYNCHKFNWKIKIPENYIIIDEKKLDELEQKGNTEFKKRANTELENSSNLIGFSLNKNSFSSSFTALSNSKKVTLEEHKKMFLENLNQAFSTIKNAKFEIKVSNATIGKYHFYKVEVEGYNASDNQLILTQIYYNSLIDEHLFAVLITYADKIQGQMLEKNFISSMQK